jgi:hypothetical protein
LKIENGNNMKKTHILLIAVAAVVVWWWWHKKHAPQKTVKTLKKPEPEEPEEPEDYPIYRPGDETPTLPGYEVPTLPGEGFVPDDNGRVPLPDEGILDETPYPLPGDILDEVPHPLPGEELILDDPPHTMPAPETPTRDVPQRELAEGLEAVEPVSFLSVRTGGAEQTVTTVLLAERPELAIDLFGRDTGELRLCRPLRDMVFTVVSSAGRVSSIAADDHAADIELSDPYFTADGFSAIDFRLRTRRKEGAITIYTIKN